MNEKVICLDTWLMVDGRVSKIRRYEDSYRIYDHIYILDDRDKRYFVKRIIDPKEYYITKELETLGLPTFPKAIHLLHSSMSMKKLLNGSKLHKIDEKIYYYMVSEEVKGNSLINELKHITKDDLEHILKTIFSSLQSAWNKLGFVHLDLHLGNIILQKEEKYLPIIIDFDYSITNQHTNDDYKNKTFLNDIWKLLGSLTLHLKDQRGELVLDYIEHFIDRHEFQERKEEFANQLFNILPDPRI